MSQDQKLNSRLTFSKYQKLAMRTANSNHLTDAGAFCNACLGLAGEVGETLELIKKHLFQGHALDLDKVKKELGDVLWYLTYFAHLFGWELAEIAELNIAKLEARYPSGKFSSEDSQKRVDESDSTHIIVS